MNRREAILAALAGGSAALGLDAQPLHWLDHVSSQDLERLLREIDLSVWRRLKSRLKAERRQAAARTRRETRADNVVLWRGPVTDALPIAEWHDVRARRRDMMRCTTTKAAAWQGHDLPIGTVILIDGRLPAETPAGRGEIVDTPRGRRVHVWL